MLVFICSCINKSLTSIHAFCSNERGYDSCPLMVAFVGAMRARRHLTEWVTPGTIQSIFTDEKLNSKLWLENALLLESEATYVPRYMSIICVLPTNCLKLSKLSNQVGKKRKTEK